MLNGFMNIPVPGVETGVKEHQEWSMEAMQKEIADLENLDNAYSVESASIGDAAIEEGKFLNMVADFKAIEGMEVKDAEAYLLNKGYDTQFALEAAKDVLARQAYMGAAKVKAIIKALISGIQKLITINGVTSKAFKSMKKVADKQLKALKKKQNSKNIQTDKFSREIHGEMDTNAAYYTKVISRKSSTDATVTGTATEADENLAEVAKGVLAAADIEIPALNSGAIRKAKATSADIIKFFSEGFADIIADAKSEFNDMISEIKDALNEKTEYEKSELFTQITSRLGSIKFICDVMSKDRTLKNLEKARKALSKLLGSTNLKNTFTDGKTGNTGHEVALDTYVAVINSLISVVTLIEKINKDIYKVFLGWADNTLTDAKAVESML